MSDRQGEKRPTPAGLWVLFGIAIAVLLVGGLVSRIEHLLAGIPIYAFGLAILVAFVVLRGRATKR